MRLLFEDNHIIVAEKPAGIGVGSDNSGDETFLEKVRTHYIENRSTNGQSGKGYCVPIHFLDRPVSGVMVFSTSSKSAERINRQFKERKVLKKYVAVVEGRPKDNSGKLVDYISKNSKVNKSWISKKSDASAKYCELSYKVLRSNGTYSELLVEPKTGRSHQIRLQLSNLGHPIVGDLKYGAKSDWHRRIALHSHSLSFQHPTKKSVVTFEKNPPEIFKDIF